RTIQREHTQPHRVETSANRMTNSRDFRLWWHGRSLQHGGARLTCHLLIRLGPDSPKAKERLVGSSLPVCRNRLKRNVVTQEHDFIADAIFRANLDKGCLHADFQDPSRLAVHAAGAGPQSVRITDEDQAEAPHVKAGVSCG